MNLIQKITRIEHPGIFRNFKWSPDVPTFSRFNLIYGWNGSGKTTLSRLLRHLEQRSVPRSGQVTICINGTDVNSGVFPETTVQVRVFNRDFVNESVFPIDGGDVPPILIVGKEGVDRQKRVDHLNKLKAERISDLSRARTKLSETERELDRHCIDRAKVIKDSLRVSGPGAYNDYDKRAYRNRAEKMALAGDAMVYQLVPDIRDSLLVQHKETIKPQIREVQYRLPSIRRLLDEVTALCSTTITARILQELKDDPELGDWTHNGLRIHKDRSSQICLFCEQTLTLGRLQVLEAHFSTEYERFLQRVDELLSELNTTVKEANDVVLPDWAAIYDDIRTHYDSVKLALEQALERLCVYAQSLAKRLEEKRREPFSILELDVVVPDIDGDVVNQLNEVIRKHNRTCDAFESYTSTARDKLAMGMIAESFDEYTHLSDASKSAETAIDPISQEVQRLSNEIEHLEREIVEHRQPAEELNSDLCKYLGHDELRLEVKNNGYAIMRHGVVAHSLSEGERTALALLYFLKSLGDRRFDLERGIVVLDDPVSSLDANALYLAFGYIRQRTQDAAQLFLLTHNFTFFRQVRNWFHHLRGQNRRDINRRPARFYMLDRVVDADPRCTAILQLDPLLEKYESEYHYLFAYVCRESRRVTPTDLARAYVLPNIARRLLEMFLAFRRPQVAGELWQKLKDIEFDDAKKYRIIRFVHTYSHGDTFGEPEHDPSILGEARLVLGDIMNFIEAQDREHYMAMVTIVTSNDEYQQSE